MDLPRDRCPSCLGLLANLPREYSATGGEVEFTYRCPDPACRHEWIVRWALDVLHEGGAAA